MNKEKKKKDFVSNEIVYKICGIPVFSKTISINEDELFKKMAVKFEDKVMDIINRKKQG